MTAIELGRRTLALALTVLLWSVAAVAGATCVGDCDGDDEVTPAELRLGTAIALDPGQASLCPAIGSEGVVTVADLVAAAGNSIGACPGAPTRTRTATAPPTPTGTPSGTPTPTTAPATATATPGGTVVPGCDNGVWTFSYADAVGTNAVTSPVQVTAIGASEARDARTGRYSWLLNGSECVDGVVFHRGVSLQAVLQTSALVPGTYPLTPPFANLLYQEIQEPLVFIRSWVNVAGGSLTIESASGNGIAFRLSAPMVPSTIVSLNSVPQGTFTLEISGTVNEIVRQ